MVEYEWSQTFQWNRSRAKKPRKRCFSGSRNAKVVVVTSWWSLFVSLPIHPPAGLLFMSRVRRNVPICIPRHWAVVYHFRRRTQGRSFVRLLPDGSERCCWLLGVSGLWLPQEEIIGFQIELSAMSPGQMILEMTTIWTSATPPSENLYGQEWNEQRDWSDV